MKKSKSEQLEMLKLPNAEIVFLDYVKKHIPCDEAQSEMFKLRNIKEILEVMTLQTFCMITDEAMVKMFDLPDAKDFILWFVQLEPLCNEAVPRIFELPNAEDIFYEYAKRWVLSTEIQRQILKLPRAKEILGACPKHFYMSDEIRNKLAEL